LTGTLIFGSNTYNLNAEQQLGNYSRWHCRRHDSCRAFHLFFFRHFLFVLMFMDLILGWLRQFNWFPKEGKRLKTVLHWAIALALFGGYLAIAASMGWLQFVPS